MDGILQAHRRPWALVVSSGALLFLGWIAIARSEQMTDGSGRLLRQQMVWSVVGIAALLAARAIDYRRLAQWSGAAFALVAVALVAVYAFPAVNGAHRWIRVGGLGIQPSELAKLVFILALAQYLSRPDAAARFVTAVVWPMSLCAALMLLVLKEPDLGTSLTFLPVLFAMLWSAGVRPRDLVRLVVAGLLLLPLLWSQMSHEQRSRVTALWEQNAPHEPATADGFHLDQAKRMFAVGGVWGNFFTPQENPSPALPNSVDTTSDNFTTPFSAATPGTAVPLAALQIRLPEPHTDSIYCIVGECFGLAGAGFVLLLYGVLIASCLQIAAQTDEPVGRLLAVGVAALFAAEVLINTGMLVGLLPITGLSLPLVSYGGSDLLAHLLALGLVVNVATRQRQFAVE